MEIPYEVKARPDTGLWNAKIGIWLFLASEVMLFGGLFSGYLFLRLGSGGEPDYYWPHGVLNVWFGFANTLILILSSVFVVVAWLQLKLREYKKFKFWMGLVVACAAIFLVNKGFEYAAKFKHYGIKLSDNSIVEGHGLDDTIIYEGIDNVLIDVARFNGAFLDDIVGEHQPQFRLLEGDTPTGEPFELSRRKVAELVRAANAAKKEQAEADNEIKRAKNEEIRAANAGRPVADQQPEEEIDVWYPADGVKQLTLVPVEAFSIKSKRSTLRKNPDFKTAAKYRDQTLLSGTISAKTPGLLLHAVDRIDLRASDADSWEDSLVWDYLGKDGHHADEHPEKEGNGSAGAEGAKGDAHGGHSPAAEAGLAREIFSRRYQAILTQASEEGKEPDYSELMSQSVLKYKYEDSDGEKHTLASHAPIVVPWEEVRLYSNFTPKWNTYYAIYFTLTGLHGLHVFLGAVVLFYFGFMSKKLYDKDPEHLANRVEVGGLFWHFVDLVWIFLFPILYLM